MAGANFTLPPEAICSIIYTADSYLKPNSSKKMREMLMKLEMALPRIKAAVKTAERKSPQSLPIRQWLNRLKAAVWTVENVLDDLKAEEIRKKLKGDHKIMEFASSSANALKNVILGDTHMARLEKAISRLQSVCYEYPNSILETEMINDKDTKRTVHSPTSDHTKRTVRCPQNHLFGRDKEIQSILNIVATKHPSLSGKREAEHKCKAIDRESEIWDNNWNLGVLSIVGLSGMGKTALAKTIYNDERMKQNFVIQAWVSISDDLGDEELIQEVVNSFKIGKARTSCDNKDQLASIIRNKKFLLVLDDVWDGRMIRNSSWDSLQEVLQEGASGSLVLVTTQCQSIANMIGTFPSVTLGALLWDDFWELFKYYAFYSFKFGKKETSTLPLPKKKQRLLEDTAKDIAMKLNRTPLEAVIIGSLLNDRFDVQQWLDIHGRGVWSVEGTSKQSTYLGAAYQNLDLELKQCLLYCAMFPRGYVFNKNKVVQMWISHGFVRPTGMEGIRITRENIGGEMFDTLVDRFFLQPASETGYVMHGFVRDLAIAISPDEYCSIDNHSGLIPEFARHLALYNYDFGIFDGSGYETIFGDNRYETLHTLMFVGGCRDPIDNALGSIFKKSSSLRVLDLSYMRIGTEGFLDIFTQLPHLRFLDLSFTGINLLPKSICDLCHLEVLNLTGCYFKKLPKRINNLINLRHLYASLETFSLISGIGKMTNLQELEEFSLRPRKGYTIDELSGMEKISGRLCVSNLDYVEKEKEAMESKLAEKKHLRCLVLKWNPNCEPKESYMMIAEKLRPPSYLSELEILNYPWIHFPSWMVQNESSMLQRIEIVGGSLEVLPPLGQIRFLQILILKDLKFVKKIETEFYGSLEEVFPFLAEFSLIGMDGLEEWNGIEGREMFPYLEKLTITSCPALKSLPSNLPLRFRKIQIVNCSEE